jgi:molybdopterin converting factor small subunit
MSVTCGKMAAEVSGEVSGEVTVVLHGYFSRRLPEGAHRYVLELAQAATPRVVAAHLGVPLGAIGLILINREQASMDTPLRAGDSVDILPLLGGGQEPGRGRQH